MRIRGAFLYLPIRLFPPLRSVFFAVLEYAWKSGKEVIDGNDFFIPSRGSAADPKDFAVRKRADFLPPAASVFAASIIYAAHGRALISTCMTLLAKHLFTEAACIPMFQERK